MIKSPLLLALALIMCLPEIVSGQSAPFPAELICIEQVTIPLTYKDYRRHAYTGILYSFSYPNGEPTFCGSTFDFESAINDGAAAWVGSCLTAIDDGSSLYNSVTWDATTCSAVRARIELGYNACQDVWAFSIIIYKYRADGDLWQYTCSRECDPLDIARPLFNVAAHEFGHAIRLNDLTYNPTLISTVMYTPICQVTLGVADVQAREYLYPCLPPCDTWGCIKSIYTSDCDDGIQYSYDLTSLSAGFYEPRSSFQNRIAWPCFADTLAHYNVLRRSDDLDEYTTIKTLAFNDTVFIDTTSISGHTYSYRTISEWGDTLTYTDEGTCGLQAISELYFYDINGAPDYAINEDTTYAAAYGCMVPTDNYLYLTSRGIVKKIDISDPKNPFVAGTRDISYLPYYYSFSQMARDMTLGYYEGYLLLTTTSYFVIINAGDNSLPVVAAMDLGTEAYAVTVIGTMAYVACQQGIKAISIQYPWAPEIWGVYSGYDSSIGRRAVTVDALNSNLIVEFDRGDVVSGDPTYTEVLQPRIYDRSKLVSFSIVCADHDSLACFEEYIDLVASEAHAMRPLRGSPMGYYSFGKADDSTFAIFNISDLTNPIVIKGITAPFMTYLYTEFGHAIASYSFDDQYLYLGLQRGTGNPWSSVYAFDIYSDDTAPTYAIGDLVIGQNKHACIASWGKYLYYFDKASDDRAYHRLQVFEKARGCDPNLAIVNGPNKLANAYEVDQLVRIYWEATGCPIRVDIKLIEDGVRVQTLASIKKFEEPNLISNYFQWPAQGISPSPENHVYQIQLLAWNIEGKYAEYSSSAFSILEEIEEQHPKDPNIIVETSLDGRIAKREFPLRGFETSFPAKTKLNYLLLPQNVAASDSFISFTIYSPEGMQLSLSELRLLSIDVGAYAEVNIEKDRIAIGPSENKLIAPLSLQLNDIIEGAGKTTNLCTREWFALPSGSKIEVMPRGTHTFAVPAEQTTTDAITRRYILSYAGSILRVADDEMKMPTRIALKNPYPNPFNPATSIDFHLPWEAEINLSIYDVSGRLVRKLREGLHRPGIFTVAWDGCDQRGKRAASGIYFCRLMVKGKKSITKKLVLMK